MKVTKRLSHDKLPGAGSITAQYRIRSTAPPPEFSLNIKSHQKCDQWVHFLWLKRLCAFAGPDMMKKSSTLGSQPTGISRGLARQHEADHSLTLPGRNSALMTPAGPGRQQGLFTRATDPEPAVPNRDVTRDHVTSAYEPSQLHVPSVEISVEEPKRLSFAEEKGIPNSSPRDPYGRDRMSEHSRMDYPHPDSYRDRLEQDRIYDDRGSYDRDRERYRDKRQQPYRDRGYDKYYDRDYDDYDRSYDRKRYDERYPRDDRRDDRYGRHDRPYLSNRAHTIEYTDTQERPERPYLSQRAYSSEHQYPDRYDRYDDERMHRGPPGDRMAHQVRPNHIHAVVNEPRFATPNKSDWTPDSGVSGVSDASEDAFSSRPLKDVKEERRKTLPSIMNAEFIPTPSQPSPKLNHVVKPIRTADDTVLARKQAYVIDEGHRKRIKAEIHKPDIEDGLPTHIVLETQSTTGRRRRKSLPDENDITSVKKPALTREEISVLSALRREEIRAQKAFEEKEAHTFFLFRASVRVSLKRICNYPTKIFLYNV